MERLTTLLNNSNIFDYFRTKHNVHTELQIAVYKITVNRLTVGLPLGEHYLPHLELLNCLHSYQPDPNAFTQGRCVTLLARLIDDACFSGMGFDTISTKLYVGNLKEFTGYDSEAEVKKLITEIDTVWKKENIAAISYENKEIHFEILKKKV